MVISKHWTGQWCRQSSSLARPNQHGSIFFQGFIPEMSCLSYAGEKQFNKVLRVVKSHRGNNEGFPTHQRFSPKAEMSCTFFFSLLENLPQLKLLCFFFLLLQSDSTKCSHFCLFSFFKSCIKWQLPRSTANLWKDASLLRSGCVTSCHKAARVYLKAPVRIYNIVCAVGSHLGQRLTMTRINLLETTDRTATLPLEKQLFRFLPRPRLGHGHGPELSIISPGVGLIQLLLVAAAFINNWPAEPWCLTVLL